VGDGGESKKIDFFSAVIKAPNWNANMHRCSVMTSVLELLYHIYFLKATLCLNVYSGKGNAT